MNFKIFTPMETNLLLRAIFIALSTILSITNCLINIEYMDDLDCEKE